MAISGQGELLGFTPGGDAINPLQTTLFQFTLRSILPCFYRYKTYTFSGPLRNKQRLLISQIIVRRMVCQLESQNTFDCHISARFLPSRNGKKTEDARIFSSSAPASTQLSITIAQKFWNSSKTGTGKGWVYKFIPIQATQYISH